MREKFKPNSLLAHEQAHALAKKIEENLKQHGTDYMIVIPHKQGSSVICLNTSRANAAFMLDGSLKMIRELSAHSHGLIDDPKELHQGDESVKPEYVG